MNEVEEKEHDKKNPVPGVFRFVVCVEEIFFTAVLATMIIAGLLPVASRWLGLPGVTWANPLAQELVLWVALFGAGAATRDRKHISIDAISHMLPPRGRLGLRALTELFAAGVCAWLTVPAVASVRSEDRAFVSDETALFGIPQTWLAAVIPVGLALLCLRFVLAAWFDAQAALSSHGKRGPP